MNTHSFNQNLTLKIKPQQEINETWNDEYPHKKMKNSYNETSLSKVSIGCSWDTENWSCAYDSVIMFICII